MQEIKGAIEGFQFVAKVVKGDDMPMYLQVRDKLGDIVTHIDFSRISEDVLEHITDIIMGG